jgi:chemosensory pili system protein ChpA (sensor histidine kinase/response regulator)
VVGARRIGDFAWSVENLLNRVIDGTLERSSAMLAALREAIAALPALVGELDGRNAEVAGLAELAARVEAHAARQPAPAAKAEPAAPSPEPTLVLQKVDVVEETRRLEALPEPPPLPEAGPPADDAWLGRPAAYAEGGDSSLQEIYQKEVQSHLEVIRAYLRHAWLAVGTHTVTEDLYRACHTLRGASRTAGACSTTIRPSTKPASPCSRTASSASKTCSRPCTRTRGTSPTSTGW